MVLRSLILFVFAVLMAMVVAVYASTHVRAQEYSLTYLCTDQGQSTFVVQNHTDRGLEPQEAYIDAGGQTLPVERVNPNGYTFVYPAIEEGKVDLYVGTEYVDSATATGKPCEVKEDGSVVSSPESSVSEDQYDSTSGDQYDSEQTSDQDRGSIEASDDAEGKNTPIESTEALTEDSEGLREDSVQRKSGTGTQLKVLPDTGGIGAFTVMAGVFLVMSGILARKDLW